MWKRENVNFLLKEQTIYFQRGYLFWSHRFQAIATTFNCKNYFMDQGKLSPRLKIISEHTTVHACASLHLSIWLFRNLAESSWNGQKLVYVVKQEVSDFLAPKCAGLCVSARIPVINILQIFFAGHGMFRMIALSVMVSQGWLSKALQKQ